MSSRNLFSFCNKKPLSIEGEDFSSANNVKSAKFCPLKEYRNPRKMQKNYMTSEEMLEEVSPQEGRLQQDMITACKDVKCCCMKEGHKLFYISTRKRTRNTGKETMESV